MSEQQSNAANVIGGGKTHYRKPRNHRHKRTLKSTYGAAYRKYNRMYGGQPEPPVPPAKVVVEEKPKESGFFDNLFSSSEPEPAKPDPAAAAPAVVPFSIFGAARDVAPVAAPTHQPYIGEDFPNFFSKFFVFGFLTVKAEHRFM